MSIPQERRELVAKLEKNRAGLLEVVRGLSEAEAEQPHKPGDRTPKAQLLHLAEAERGWVGWARRARDEEKPDLNAPRGFGEGRMFEEANALKLAELLERLRETREETLRFLAETSDEELLRQGRNTPFGDLTVLQMLRALYRHDQMHANEIAGREPTYVIRTKDGRRV